MQRKLKEKIKKEQIKNEVLKKKSDKVKEKELIRLKDQYVFNFLNGRYWLEMYNLYAKQYTGELPTSKLDGVEKPMSLILAEALLYKRRAMNGFRAAYGELLELKKFGLKEKEIDQLIIDFQSDKIKKEEYDLTLLEDEKQGFVNVDN